MERWSGGERDRHEQTDRETERDLVSSQNANRETYRKTKRQRTRTVYVYDCGGGEGWAGGWGRGVRGGGGERQSKRRRPGAPRVVCYKDERISILSGVAVCPTIDFWMRRSWQQLRSKSQGEHFLNRFVGVRGGVEGRRGQSAKGAHIFCRFAVSSTCAASRNLPAWYL